MDENGDLVLTFWNSSVENFLVATYKLMLYCEIFALFIAITMMAVLAQALKAAGFHKNFSGNPSEEYIAMKIDSRLSVMMTFSVMAFVCYTISWAAIRTLRARWIFLDRCIQILALIYWFLMATIGEENARGMMFWQIFKITLIFTINVNTRYDLYNEHFWRTRTEGTERERDDIR